MSWAFHSPTPTHHYSLLVLPYVVTRKVSRYGDSMASSPEMEPPGFEVPGPPPPPPPPPSESPPSQSQSQLDDADADAPPPGFDTPNAWLPQQQQQQQQQQPGASGSGAKPPLHTLLSCPTMGPLEARSSLLKLELLDPAMLVPPPPPPPPSPPPSLPPQSQSDHLNQNSPTAVAITSQHNTLPPPQPPFTLQHLGPLDPAMLQPPPPPPPPPSPPPQFNSQLGIPSVPQMTQSKFDNPNMLQPIQHETPHILSSQTQTGPQTNQITNEPPLNKFPDMHEMQGQFTPPPQACPSEVEKGPLVSHTPEVSPHREEDMAALQIDMDMSEDDFDRSPTHMGPPGSDTRDSDSLEEAPPGYDTIDSNCQMEMISQDALSGMGQMVCGNCSELISYPCGAFHVLCTCCQTINLVLQACQVGNIICGQCSLLLIYPFGAPSVRCSCCRYVTEIGAHNVRPPLSIQQGEGYPNLELQLTEIS